MKFRCPHCRERTITAGAKLKASGFGPGVCPACGGRFVPVVWATLPIIAVLSAAYFVPLLFLRGPDLPPLWLVVSICFALVLALSLPTYLFLVPLLRHGSAAARWDQRTYAAALAAAVLLVIFAPAKEREPPATPLRGAVGTHVSSAEGRAGLKAALERAAVPYTTEVREGKEFIIVEKQHADAFGQVERDFWGLPPPGHGSVHFDNPKLAAEFRAWLGTAGIEHHEAILRQRPHVVWKGSQDLVRQFIETRPSDCPRAQADAPRKC